jgi:hypothetical protein
MPIFDLHTHRSVSEHCATSRSGTAREARVKGAVAAPNRGGKACTQRDAAHWVCAPGVIGRICASLFGQLCKVREYMRKSIYIHEPFLYVCCRSALFRYPPERILPLCVRK